jgi:acyl carrier protein
LIAIWNKYWVQGWAFLSSEGRSRSIIFRGKLIMAVKKTIKVEDTLHKIIARVIKREDFILTPAATFKGLGADSLEVVRILVTIEEAFDIDLVDEDMKAITNMGEFINYIKKKIAEKK